MRNRHFPRLCQSCQAPMQAQEDLCWRCGVTWTSEPGPVALRLVDGGADPAVKPDAAAPVSTAERLAGLIAEARA